MGKKQRTGVSSFCYKPHQLRETATPRVPAGPREIILPKTPPFNFNATARQQQQPISNPSLQPNTRDNDVEMDNVMITPDSDSGFKGFFANQNRFAPNTTNSQNGNIPDTEMPPLMHSPPVPPIDHHPTLVPAEVSQLPTAIPNPIAGSHSIPVPHDEMPRTRSSPRLVQLRLITDDRLGWGIRKKHRKQQSSVECEKLIQRLHQANGQLSDEKHTNTLQWMELKRLGREHSQEIRGLKTIIEDLKKQKLRIRRQLMKERDLEQKRANELSRTLHKLENPTDLRQSIVPFTRYIGRKLCIVYQSLHSILRGPLHQGADGSFLNRCISNSLK